MAHVIVLDSVNEDIFVCGLCKSVFNSLELFLDHKRSKCVHHNLGCILTNESVFLETSSACNPVDNALTSELQAESTETPRESAINELIYSTPLVCNSGENALTSKPLADSTEEQREAALDVLIYSETPLVYNASDNTITKILQPEYNTETACETSINELVFSEASAVCYPGGDALTSELQAESTESPHNSAINELINSTPLVCYPGENALTNEPLADSTEEQREAALDVLIYSETPLVYNAEDNALTNILLSDCTTESPPETTINDLIFTDASSVCYPGDDALNSEPLAESTETPSDDALDKLICTICKKKFKLKKGLLAHIKSHYDKPYQCLVCGKCFFQKSHLKRHILTHKVWPEGLSKTTPKCPEEELLCYSCPYCTMMFSSYNQFRSHLKNHQAFKKFKCIQGDCKDFYDTFEMLIHHVASFHITQLYICHICKAPFNSLESIASHNGCGKISIETKQYKCSQCEAVFTKPEKLYLHMLTENHQKVCIHCNKTFASDKRLRLHLQIHRDLKPFQCNICHCSFHMKRYLNSHMLKHGNKEFVCSVCKHKFSRSDLLQRHMRSHNPNKMIQCPYKLSLDCKREFSRKDKLKIHLRSHIDNLAEEESANDENVVTDSSRHQVAINSNTE